MNRELQALLHSANARLQVEARALRCYSGSELVQPISRACLKVLSVRMSWAERRACAIKILPDGVLLVLARWLSVYQLWTLANTCSSMRRRLKSFSELWNSFQTIEFNNNRAPRDVVARTIARFADRPPARLHVFARANTLSRGMINLLNDWIVTLEVLHVQFYFEPWRGSNWQNSSAVVDALTRAAPNLETLRFSPGSSDGGMLKLPTSFLGGTAGRLRRCVLEDVCLDLSAPGLYPAFSTVTTFRLSLIDRNDHSIGLSSLQTLLDSLPLLENFAITFKRFSGIAEGDPAPTLRLPPRLQHFAIINFSTGPVEIASAFGTVPTMTIAGVDPNLYNLFPGGIHLLLPKHEHIRIRFVDEAEGARTVTMFSRYHRRLPSATMQYLGMHAPTTARVTRVQLHEWQWSTFSALPTLPHLEDLYIILASCSEYDPRVQHGAGLLFLSSPLGPGMTKFNALQKLELYSGVRYWDTSRDSEECAQLRRRLALRRGWFGGSKTCDCHLKCPLSLDGVADFISWLIDTDRRLSRLILGGITDIVDGDPATALDRLESMTETIDIVEQPPRDIVRDCRMNPRDSGYLGMPVVECFSFDDDFSSKDNIDPE